MASYFAYDKLPDPTSYIRLLRVAEGEPRFEFKLDTVPLQQAQNEGFIAVSHHWEDSGRSRRIGVNGSDFIITKSLFLYLNRLYERPRGDLQRQRF